MKTAGVIEPKNGSVQAANPEQADPERRRSPRYDTLIGAFIGSERGRRDMRCYILNVSDTGALLRPHDVLLCPSQFMLKPEAGEQRKCEVVWTNGDMLAVRFVGERVPPLTAREWASLGSEPTTDLIEAH